MEKRERWAEIEGIWIKRKEEEGKRIEWGRESTGKEGKRRRVEGKGRREKGEGWEGKEEKKREREGTELANLKHASEEMQKRVTTVWEA